MLSVSVPRRMSIRRVAPKHWPDPRHRQSRLQHDPEADDGNEPLHYASPTAAICDSAALHGATPGPDEPDNRFLWDESEAIAGIEQAVRLLIENVAPDGTQLADERESLLWGFVNMLHAQAGRIDRPVDRIVQQMRDLERAQDGTEVKAHELETLTRRAHDLGDRRDAFEKMRDFAAEAYRVETGTFWRPRHGSHASQTRKLTSAAIDARDFRRARKDREIRAHNPDLLFSRILLARLAPDVPYRRLGAVSQTHGFLSHLRSLRSLR